MAIAWLKHFKNTELLQQILGQFQFSELEIAAYRSNWSRWLRPNAALRNEGQNGDDPFRTGAT